MTISCTGRSIPAPDGPPARTTKARTGRAFQWAIQDSNLRTSSLSGERSIASLSAVEHRSAVLSRAVSGGEGSAVPRSAVWLSSRGFREGGWGVALAYSIVPPAQAANRSSGGASPPNPSSAKKTTCSGPARCGGSAMPLTLPTIRLSTSGG